MFIYSFIPSDFSKIETINKLSVFIFLFSMEAFEKAKELCLKIIFSEFVIFFSVRRFYFLNNLIFYFNFIIYYLAYRLTLK